MTLLLCYRAEKMERAVAFTRRATRRAARRAVARRAAARRAAARRGPPGGNSANPDAAKVAPLVRRRTALHHGAPVRRRSALQRSRNSCSSSSSSDESYLPESTPFFCSPPFFHRLYELHLLCELRLGAENGNWSSERRHCLCPRVTGRLSDSRGKKSAWRLECLTSRVRGAPQAGKKEKEGPEGGFCGKLRHCRYKM